jgi:arylsulfatase A-like enzyme
MKKIMLSILVIVSLGFIQKSARQNQGTALILPPTNSPNILSISVDDLNDWIGCMQEHPQALTPNIDKLAREGVLFTNAHCQAPICGPSRASVMTGLYPTSTGIYLQVKDKEIHNTSNLTQKVVFLNDYFEQFGYKTMGVGKIYHEGDGAKTFDEYGSSFEHFGPSPKKRLHYDPVLLGLPNKTQTDWGAFPEADSLMPDYKAARWAVERIQQKHDKPFFLSVGFIRPHVPWHVPKKWFDMFPVEKIQLPPYLETDMEDISEMGKNVAELKEMPTTKWCIEKNEWKNAIQGYLASMAFVDAQIGKVLKALEESPYHKNTIVVLWSDHGYHMGEKNRFAKQSLWQRSTHSPLIFRTPWQEKNVVRNEPVQLLDIYPTLSELCQLPANSMNEGHSLVPLFNPKNKSWQHNAITSFGQNNTAITGKRYKLIRYEDGSKELYDLKNDYNEWVNLAIQKKYIKTILELEKSIPKNQSLYVKENQFGLNDYFKTKKSGND